MGFFNELDLEIGELYFRDGLKEEEIARIVGVSVAAVHQSLAHIEDADYSFSDSEDPTEYAENAADLDAEFYGQNG